MSDILIRGLEMKPGLVKVELGYDADCHPMALVGEDVYDVVVIESHSNLIDQPQDGMTVHIVVGNFVVLNEYDKNEDLFTPEDKKWLKERTTVFLPLRMSYTE